jgi:hypothetical protein
MAHKNNASTVIKNFPDRGDGSFYPCIIGDLIFVIQWHIEIYPDQRLLAFEVIRREF